LIVLHDEGSERLKYFITGVEISGHFKPGRELSADEFYALALPFHSYDLQLQEVFPGFNPPLPQEIRKSVLTIF
jgi:hypothetical protein